MKIVKGLKNSVYAFHQAHRIIWSAGIWRYFIIPIILTIIYLPILIAGCVIFAHSVSKWIFVSTTLFVDMGPWVRWIIKLILFLLVGFFGVLTYRNMVMIFYSPFLDGISEKVEEMMLGRKVKADRNLRETIIRVVIVAFLSILASGGLLFLSAIISSIPLIGGLISLFGLLPVQLFISGTGNVDPFLARNGYDALSSVTLMRKHFTAVTSLSILSSLVMMIPFFGWFIGPTYAVVAGVVLGIVIDEKEKSQPSTVSQ